MAERRHGSRRGDARGGGRGGGRGDFPNEEAARQRDLRDIENNDLRQQVRDLQRDIENGDLPYTTRIYCRCRCMISHDEDILSMPVYDKHVYDEDIFYELPGLTSKSSPPFVKFDDAAEYEGVAVIVDKEYTKDELMRKLAEQSLS
ncbi:hypothetical protein SASPL_108667 [Salvia splendens]|uniref:Uncharacterized protein n=1 Tax=Salvia splendens TaxID=180675 RepID=A0A8X8YH45_SALSN|nr:hypothetical protein SASPL_108667 [Salvia splendens]